MIRICVCGLPVCLARAFRSSSVCNGIRYERMTEDGVVPSGALIDLSLSMLLKKNDNSRNVNTKHVFTVISAYCDLIAKCAKRQKSADFQVFRASVQ